jgi:hypothetical protein
MKSAISSRGHSRTRRRTYKELARLFAQFVDIRENTDYHSSLSFIFSNPVLLSIPKWHQILEGHSSTGPDNDPARLQLAHRFCMALLRRFQTDIEEYQIGKGPIENIFNMHQNLKEISFEVALTLVKRPELNNFLSSIYIRRISLATQGQALANEWRSAFKLQRLVLAAVNSRTQDDETFEMRVHATLSWLEIATLALIHVPDGRLHREAATEADRLIRDAAARGDSALQAHTTYMLGVLYLDPYIVGRTTVGFAEQLLSWKQRIEQELDPVTRARHQAEIEMAPPEESFRTAIELLKKAAADQDGRDRGVALKKLADAMFWLEVVGGGLNLQEFDEITATSIKLLDPAMDQTLIPELASYRIAKKLSLDEGSSSNPAPGFIDHVLVSTEDELKTLASNPLGLVNTLITAAVSALEHNPQRAIEIYRKSWELCRLLVSDENAKINNLQNGLNVLRRVYGRDRLQHVRTADTCNITKAFQDLHRRANTESWNREELASAVVSLIIFAADLNLGQALTMLADAESVYRHDTKFFLDNVHLLNFLRFKIHVGIASKAEESTDYDAAWRHYVAAWDGSVLFRFRELETGCLSRLLALVSSLSPQQLLPFATEVAGRALAGQGHLSTRRDEAVVEISRAIIAKAIELGQEDPNIGLILFMWQIVKGLRFTAALYRWKYDWQSDEIGLTILEKIKEFRGPTNVSAPARLRDSPTSSLDEEVLLSTYIPADQEPVGVGRSAQINNLMRQYDAHVSGSLSKSLQVDGPLDFNSLLMDGQEIQERIGPRTVLAIQYVGRSSARDLVLNTMIITSEEFYFCNDLIAYPKDAGFFVDIGKNRKWNFLDFFGGIGAMIRSYIQEDPEGDRVVSEHAVKYLEYCRELLFHSSNTVLKQLRARGKDHLCLVPHGALHFIPVHLLGSEGSPLGEEWIVTALPNLAMLKRRSGSVLVRAKEMAAFGLQFGPSRPHKLEAIPGAIDEARRIATLFGVEPQLDEKATKPALFSALEQARFVHLATHGNHNVAAPSFQNLYMTPDDRSDGIVHAYEVLNLDLRGLEVASLSACETALGRFDTVDNLRGLPANLFIRGTRTIVGTLWEVETEAAVNFFTTFYEKLRNGTSNLDAFGSAQSETRKSHPQYRDWGAFYLMGHWGHPGIEGVDAEEACNEPKARLTHSACL